MLNLSFFLQQSADRFPTKTAIILDDYKISYAELNGAANKMANGLINLGVRQGSKVALMLPNIPQFAIAYYGILKTGATVVPLNVFLKHNEIKYHLEDSDSVALVVWEDFLDEAIEGMQMTETCKHLIVVQSSQNPRTLPNDPQILPFTHVIGQASPVFDCVQTMPDDIAVILYTSGTTGHPKGAELTHFNIFSNSMISADRVAHVKAGDVGLAMLPFFHAFGQTCMLNACIYAGATISLMVRFEPKKTLEVMQRDRVSFFAAVPTMYSFLLRHPNVDSYDLSSLNSCISGGSAMPVEVMNAFNEKYGVTILEGYGLSETSPVASFNHIERPPKPGSIGTPIWGTRMAIVDDNDHILPPGEEGELVIRGHNVMKGYHKNPEATAEVMRGGWFHTGDIARMDEDGYFFIVDRKKDMILRAGMNVYPREVEEVLYGHPAIAEAAVVGEPHPIHGERVKACIVLNPNEEAPSEHDIIHYCKERMAEYKIPRVVEFRESLPKNATGKILRRELRTHK